MVILDIAQNDHPSLVNYGASYSVQPIPVHCHRYLLSVLQDTTQRLINGYFIPAANEVSSHRAGDARQQAQGTRRSHPQPI